MAEREYTVLEARFEVFCKAWGIEMDSMTDYEKAKMIQSYYLDILCGMIQKAMSPSPVVVVKPPAVG